MSWRKHLAQRHHLGEEELYADKLDRDQVRLSEYHDFQHLEYPDQLDHSHDEFGQLVEGRRSAFDLGAAEQ